MRTRLALGSVLFAVVASMAPGTASTPTCVLLRDGSGDVMHPTGAGARIDPRAPWVDATVLSLAVDARHLTISIDLVALDPAADAVSGANYKVAWGEGSDIDRVGVAAERDGTSWSFFFGRPWVWGAGQADRRPIIGSVQGDRITMLVPIAWARASARDDVLRDVQVETSLHLVGASGSRVAPVEWATTTGFDQAYLADDPNGAWRPRVGGAFSLATGACN